MKKKVCHLVCYKDDNYVRNLVIRKSLQRVYKNSLFISNKKKGFLKYFEVLINYVRFHRDTDILYIGFRGVDIYLLILFFLRFKTEVILDALVSPTVALRYDRKGGIYGYILSFPIFYIEKWLLKKADKIVVDTESFKKCYNELFGINQDKIFVLPVGAVNISNSLVKYEAFTVLFYGSFLPLHGCKHIIEAVKLINNKNIKFLFIGGGKKTEELIHRELQGLNYEYFSWVPYEKLVNCIIPKVHLGFAGPFGSTYQSNLVITGKAYQFINSLTPVIIGSNQESYIFEDKVNAIVVQRGCSDAIAKGVVWAFSNQQKLAKIAMNAKKLYQSKFSDALFDEKIKQMLNLID